MPESDQQEQPPLIDVEVVSGSAHGPEADRGPNRPGPPVHPLASAVLVAVDSLWSLTEWSVVSWWITIPASFITVFVPTLLVQRYVRGDPPKRALRLAWLLGGLAAIPTSVFGTPVGLTLLAWSGLNRLLGR
ncbi:MAG: hypothetical protein D6766_13875 [Verrucomicrobia bacterium]|nr:MAG: hypothetical protein D6766_13875 [Verrucomicrobiota bacterium]